jgi:putative tryptophan/tyrosine transport system substrate-binding protein
LIQLVAVPFLRLCPLSVVYRAASAAFALLLVSCHAVLAQTIDRDRLDIRVVVGEATNATKTVTEALAKKYPSAVVERDAPNVKFTPSQLVVTVGSPAARSACKNASIAHLVVLFVTSIEYERILQTCDIKSITAIFAETSPRAQLDLIREIFGSRSHIAVLTSDVTTRSHERLLAAIRSTTMTTHVEPIPDTKDVVRSIARLPLVDVLLVTTDSGVYTSDNIREILESTYRRSIPMVGFNPSSVNAGMLAASFANVDDVLNHFDEVLRTFAATGRLTEASYPKYWRVAFNQSVARSLSVDIPSQAKLLGRSPTVRSN